MMKRKVCSKAVAAALSLAICPAALAQSTEYPVKPVRIVIPFPPGGNGDALVRPIAAKLVERWGQQIVVDNRAGANAIIGTELVSRAAPDGYTLLLSTASTMSINPNVYAKLPYDAVKDFVPVAPITYYSYVVASHPSVPARTPRELVALAKARPGELTYASTGNGSTGHLAGALLESLASIRLLHVPYKGSGPASVDFLAGQVMLNFTGMAIVVPHLKSGRLRVIGICSEKRLPSWPDIPAFGELGLKGYEGGTWFGIAAPAGTPRAIVARLNEAITAAIRTPDVSARYATLGFDLYTASPEEFARFIEVDRARTAKVVKSANIRMD